MFRHLTGLCCLDGRTIGHSTPSCTKGKYRKTKEKKVAVEKNWFFWFRWIEIELSKIGAAAIFKRHPSPHHQSKLIKIKWDHRHSNQILNIYVRSPTSNLDASQRKTMCPFKGESICAIVQRNPHAHSDSQLFCPPFVSSILWRSQRTKKNISSNEYWERNHKK